MPVVRKIAKACKVGLAQCACLGDDRPDVPVMRAVGLSYSRLLRVPYAITLVLAAVNLVVVGYLQPMTRYWYEQLQFELRSGALGASIKVGEFTTLQDKMALRIEQSREEGRQLIGIFARVASPKGQVLTILAREGRFLALKGAPDTIILRLTQGQIVQDQPGQNPRVLSFTRHDLPIDLPIVLLTRPGVDDLGAKAARPDAIIATGRSDYVNQVNNVLCFPFV